VSATLPLRRGSGRGPVGTRTRRTAITGTTSGAPPEERTGVDARALAAELIREVAGEVRFSDASRALYASDLSLYRQVPIGVVIPKTYDDVEATLAACRRHRAPILGRGCGTSLLGQGCNVAVILDFSKYLNRILEIDPERRTARVQPGVINDQLREAAEEHGLTFAPDPATHDYCTIGGQIGNNSCGTHSMMGGRTADNVLALDVITYDGERMTVGATSQDELARIVDAGGRRGEIYRELRALRDRYGDAIRGAFPDIPRRVSGYTLEQLLPEHDFNVARALVGSESSCALWLEAAVRLVPSPPKRALVVCAYDDRFAAGDHVAEILALDPIGLEGFDSTLVENMKRKGRHGDDIAQLPDGRAWLLVEFGGETQDEANERAEAAQRTLKRHHGAPVIEIFEDPVKQDQVWAVRKSGVGDSRVPGELDTWPGWEDAAVPPDRLGEYLREFDQLIQRHGYHSEYHGHFGQGCIHTRIDFDVKTAHGVANMRAFMEEATDLVVKYGGSISGEHGEGQSRAELLGRMYPRQVIDAFVEFKRIWDPAGMMNPGKGAGAALTGYRLDENLRLGPGYRPPPVQTYFSFSRDHGSFAEATERCFGVGQCRQLDGSTMCPSFMATRDERYTTRGRTRLLFEMLQGEAIHDGWHDEEIKESLDLCLACKGCRGDCPVHVDVATYKAEFFAHYYERRLRPLSAYALGLIPVWARLAAHTPRLANMMASLAPVKRLAGITRHRELPKFARQTFRDWFEARGGPARPDAPRVVLWPDTFTNHFQPRVGQAAVQVLEHEGFCVELTPDGVCCGRPLFDFGMLKIAKRFARRNLDLLGPLLSDGATIVGLEPSCIAAFRDETGDLCPQDEDARRLAAQTKTLAEFLRAGGYEPPKLSRPAIVQGHCHHKAIMGLDAERALLEAMGVEWGTEDWGCCGMAGSFGYEDHKYDISMKVGERHVLPAVRSAPDALVIADGFSCRSQVKQGAGREALHTAEVIALALGAQGAASKS
jgi:FAD/FMN-containing dehydrogenase/Fe-S oxidoreductase